MPRISLDQAATDFIHAREQRIATRRKRSKARKDRPCTNRDVNTTCLQSPHDGDETICDNCKEMVPFVREVAKADQFAAGKLETLKRAVLRAESRKEEKPESDHPDQSKLF